MLQRMLLLLLLLLLLLRVVVGVPVRVHVDVASSGDPHLLSSVGLSSIWSLGGGACCPTPSRVVVEGLVPTARATTVDCEHQYIGYILRTRTNWSVHSRLPPVTAAFVKHLLLAKWQVRAWYMQGLEKLWQLQLYSAATDIIKHCGDLYISQMHAQNTT